MTALNWLPVIETWRARVRALGNDPAHAWAEAVALANARIDFVQTNLLDAMLQRALAGSPPPGLQTRPVRLAILGSSTLAHLHAAIRVGALRRGILVSTYENEYGQYLQDLDDAHSGLAAFRPEAILFAFDARHLTAGLTAAATREEADAAFEEATGRIAACWERAAARFACPLVQQTVMPCLPAGFGENEARLPGSRPHLIERINFWMRTHAERHGVDLLALDTAVQRDGLAAWHSAALWHRSKQEVLPAAAPRYGDLLARLLAARQGRSAKCLVLDLDNTIWGGVIGDDGLDGIALGQGSALGEAFASVQDYAKELSRRGVILAVCSKNDEANALEAFDKHPEMVLRRNDIASFMANWNDKATNIRAIAEELNIGLDSLVFLDDNPFERALVRQELPMVMVPEVPEDPSLVPACLAEAGYFEGLGVTDEDRQRTSQYQGNRAREALKASTTDLPAYLRGLEMQLLWRRFDRVGLQRTVQLINKTNQFNLTTRRYTEAEVIEVMDSNRAFGLQLRLLDRFGDNGVIAIVIGRMQQDETLLIDTWLMSCRVLGRQVEPTTLNLVAAEARRLGATALVGEYVPSKKNAMVRRHYAQLGFQDHGPAEPGGTTRHILALHDFVPADTFIATTEG